MTQAVYGAGGGAYAGGSMFVPGGTKPDYTYYDKMQVYDGVSWTVDSQIMPMPKLLGGGGWAESAVCADGGGKVHVVNGFDGQFFYAAHQIYDPAAPAGARWTLGTAPVLPGGVTSYASYFSGCAFIGGKLYLFGGDGIIGSLSEEVLNATWVYDPVLDMWGDTGKLMLSPRVLHGYTNSAQAAYAAGGLPDLVSNDMLNTVERFRPATGWVLMASMPVGRGAMGMGLLGSTLAIWGGIFTSTYGELFIFGELLTCPPGCTAWRDSNENLATRRFYIAGASSGTTLYAAGGFDPTGAVLASVEKRP
jgi:hypothetical protein